MGAYRITIVGMGPHHNAGSMAASYDAEKLAGRFLRSLGRNNHTLLSATFEQLGQVESLHPQAINEGGEDLGAEQEAGGGHSDA